MDKKSFNQRKYIFSAVIILFFLLLIGVFSSKKKKEKVVMDTDNVPVEELAPTVDGSVRVELNLSGDGKKATLIINQVPEETKSIDYQLSYQTKEKGLQGVIGKIEVEPDNKDYKKVVTLGTCSSGVCIYHNVVGKIKLSLVFNGTYGEKSFIKDFSI